MTIRISITITTSYFVDLCNYIYKTNNNYCNKISITGCVMLKLLMININIVI